MSLRKTILLINVISIFAFIITGLLVLLIVSLCEEYGIDILSQINQVL